MSFSLDTRNVKYLHNYEAALRCHDSIKPLRGTDVRPIAERRKHHFNIRKQGDGPEGTVIVRLYATDVVTYTSPSHPTEPNRIILNMGNHPSISTRNAIHAVAGVTVISKLGSYWVRDHDGKEYLYRAGMQLQTGDYYRSHKIIDPVYPVIHVLDRKALNAIKKSYIPFTKHLRGFIKLVGENGFDEDMLKDVPFTMLTSSLMHRATGTHEQMHEAALYITKEARTFSRIRQWGQPPASIVRLRHAMTCLNNHIIALHADTLLEKKIVTTGKPVKDRYAWAEGRPCRAT